MNIIFDNLLSGFNPLDIDWPEWLTFPRIFGLSDVASAMVLLSAFVAILVIIFIIEVTINKHRSESHERKSIIWDRRERKRKSIRDAQRKYEGEELNEEDNEPVDTGIKVREEDEQKKAAVVLGGNLGMSAKKKEEDENVPPEVINGYLQKSNTAPIRPVYSNTPSARAAQKADLESDVEEEAAKYEPPKKVKTTSLKRPTASKTVISQEEEADKATDPYGAIVRPVVGSEVANAEVERPAEVSDVTPRIAKTGLDAANEAAKAPVKGFAAPPKEPIKRPKQANTPSAESPEEAIDEAEKKAEAVARFDEQKKARLEKKDDGKEES